MLRVILACTRSLWVFFALKRFARVLKNCLFRVEILISTEIYMWKLLYYKRISVNKRVRTQSVWTSRAEMPYIHCELHYLYGIIKLSLPRYILYVLSWSADIVDTIHLKFIGISDESNIFRCAQLFPKEWVVQRLLRH